MMFPISEYFRILVIGSAYQRIAQLIEEKLGFRTSLCEADEVAAVVHGGADICAIVAGRADVATAVEARDARGFSMPIFLLSRRADETFDEPYLKSLDGVFIADLETREFYRKRLMASIEKYVASLMTPFFGALMSYDFDANRTWACLGRQGGQMFMHHPVGRLSSFSYEVQGVYQVAEQDKVRFYTYAVKE